MKPINGKLKTMLFDGKARQRCALLIALVALSILDCQLSVAQYYSWGSSPAAVKWRQLKTDNVKLVYPSDFEQRARRVMWYLDTMRTHASFGFHHGTMRTPVVLHTQNMSGNGMVMWAPKRIELLAAPGASYSEPWLKQLAFHEYRHNVQYNNLRRGLIRPLTILLGQQAAFLGVGQFSIFMLEGDAVMAETEMSAFGRGLQPSWTMHYRAVGDVGSSHYPRDYWFSGSFRDYVPDHYRLGYQMVRWSYDRFDRFIWDDVARYVVRNPQWIAPLSAGLRRHWGISQMQLFQQTFADLNAYWASLPRVDDSSRRLEVQAPGRPSRHTTYQWPLWIDGGKALVAFKSDLDRAPQMVRVDVASGRERRLAYTGPVSSRPAVADGVVWWSELRRSMLWSERVFSRLRSYDLDSGRRRTYRSREQVFYPTPTGNGAGRDGLAYVAYNYSGDYAIVRGDGRRTEMPDNVEITGLAWDDASDKLFFTGLDDGGMFLGEAGDNAGWRRLTPSRHITISDLRAAGGRLYFGSIASGKDEAHYYDLASGIEYRLTSSTYGSFQPSTPLPSGDNGGRVVLTTYDKHGYHLAIQDAGRAVRQPQRSLPVNLVNPPLKRWSGARMTDIVYTEAEAAKSVRELKPRRFSKTANIFRPHSYVPLDFYPPNAIYESDLTMNLGVTVMSQSLLSDAVSWAAYGWNRTGGSMVRGGLSYSGLGPVIDVDFSWGGAPQTLYTSIPQRVDIVRDRQLSVTGRLSLPMTLSSGAWISSLTPSAEYYYTNGLIFKEISSLKTELTRGVERLTLTLGYTGQTRMAQKEFLPRLGVSARIGYVSNPTNNDFRSLMSASLGVWLPGIARPHSLRLRGAWQQATGSSDGRFMFRMKEVFPRGARYDFSAREWRSGSVDYQLPVWYPEGGIPGVVYVKRVRLNLFADYSLRKNFKDPNRAAGSGVTLTIVDAWRELYSYGAEVIVDLSPLRLPAGNHFSVRFTFARPSDSRSPFFNFAIEMPI